MKTWEVSYPAAYELIERAMRESGRTWDELNQFLPAERIEAVLEYCTAVLEETDSPAAFRNRYEHDIVWDIAEVARKGFQTANPPRYDALFLTVGMSWEPILFTIFACGPREVCFIVTSDSKKTMNKVLENLRGRDIAFEFGNISHFEIGGTELTELFEGVREKMVSYSAKKYRCAIDVTAGKKSMTAGATLIANALDVDTLYVESYYDEQRVFKGPVPLSETVLRLPKPEVETGHRQIRQAMQMFNDGQYASASHILESLEGHVLDDRPMRVVRGLASGFHSIELFDFETAAKRLQEALDDMKRFRLTLYQGVMDKLQFHLQDCQQMGDLKEGDSAVLPEESLWSLVGRNFASAEQHALNGRFDFGCLLLYRCMELGSQIGLRMVGLNPFGDLKVESSEVESRWGDIQLAFAKTKRQATRGLDSHKTKDSNEDVLVRFPIPEKVALIDGLILFSCVYGILRGEEGIRFHWSRIINVLQSRNSSRLAHGLKPLAEGEYKNLRSLVLSVVKEIWCMTALGQRSGELEKWLEAYAAPVIEDLHPSKGR